jgi:hypothetical protein
MIFQTLFLLAFAALAGAKKAKTDLEKVTSKVWLPFLLL